MESITIRKVTIRELEQLEDISKQTFYETFSSDNTEENMQKYLGEALSTQRLADEINDPDSDFYFAILHKEVIGYLKLNTGDAQTEIKDGDAIEIERIYVVKKYLGKKWGRFYTKRQCGLPGKRMQNIFG